MARGYALLTKSAECDDYSLSKWQHTIHFFYSYQETVVMHNMQGFLILIFIWVVL